jgi:WD40 repeat protein
MKIKMLDQASKADGAAPAAYQSVIDRVMLTLEDTLESDDYPSSLALIDAAEEAAKRLRSLALVSSMRKKREEIARSQKEFARWQPFFDKLAKNPKDADANLEMGKYYALVKGNWERGLPLLAEAPKGALRALSRSDYAGPETEKTRRIVALGWYQFATGEQTDPAMKTQALLRSFHWYQENLVDANDKERALIESKLQEISNMLPPEYRIGEITAELKKIDVNAGPVYGCAISPDGRRLLATGYNGNLVLFNAKTFKEQRQLEGHSGKVWSVAFALNGQQAVSGGFDQTVRLWDLAAGREAKSFTGHRDYVRSVAISGDGKWILSGGDDRTVRLWNVATGKEERTMGEHGHSVWSVALSRDGKRAVSASLDKTVRYWDVEKGENIRKLEGHTDTVLCVAFTPDGKHAVSGSTDKTIRVWDLTNGETIATCTGSTGYIQSVAVSPDGRRILSAGADNVVRLWDTRTGKEIRRLEGHRDQVWHVAFSRDGRLAISSGQDYSVRVWSGPR